MAKVGLWLLCEAHAGEMEPFVLAAGVITGYHVAVRDVLAEAIHLFYLIPDVTATGDWVDGLTAETALLGLFHILNKVWEFIVVRS